MKGDAKRIAQMHTIERAIQADPMAAHRRMGNVLVSIFAWGFITGGLLALVIFRLWPA